MGRVRSAGYTAELVYYTSQRLLCVNELQHLQDALNAPGKSISKLALSLSQCAIVGSGHSRSGVPGMSEICCFSL